MPLKRNGEPQVQSDDEVFPQESMKQVARSVGVNPKRRKSATTHTSKRAKITKGASSSKAKLKEPTMEDEEKEFSSTK